MTPPSDRHHGQINENAVAMCPNLNFNGHWTTYQKITKICSAEIRDFNCVEIPRDPRYALNDLSGITWYFSSIERLSFCRADFCPKAVWTATLVYNQQCCYSVSTLSLKLNLHNLCSLRHLLRVKNFLSCLNLLAYYYASTKYASTEHSFWSCSEY